MYETLEGTVRQAFYCSVVLFKAHCFIVTFFFTHCILCLAKHPSQALVWERLLQSRITQLKQIINKETLNESQETIKIIRKYLLTDVTPQNEKCNLTQFATHFLHLGLKSHQTSNCMNLNKQYSIGEVHMPIWITMTKYLRLFNQGNTRIH